MLKRMALGSVLSLSSVLAIAQQAPGTAAAPSSAWATEIQDYAVKTLDNEQALSLAALPLDGPGSAQYLNADALMKPGSIVKLVTTYAALELLGPNYRWDTDFLTDGILEKDILKGDLYVRLGGDPKLTLERLRGTLADLRGMGISTIEGDLVLDGSYFRLPDSPPAFEDNGDNPYAPFLVEPSAYLTNFNLLHLQVAADERGTRAWVTPNLPGVSIEPRVSAQPPGPCPAGKQFEWEALFQEGQQVTVRVTGKLPRGCRTGTYLSLLPHKRYSVSLIRTILGDLGITVQGTDRFDTTPEDARRLLRTTSPDLASMVRDINKWSNNVMARQLLLAVGAELRGDDEQDDLASGTRAIGSWLESKGISTMVIENGAGLSRVARITAHQGALLLKQAWGSLYAPDLLASMPLIAMDGTMARRLRNTGMDGQGRIKTGSLDHVRSIAGFTHDKRGTTWAIVAMVNNNPAWNGQAVLDRVLYTLYFRPPAEAQPPRQASTGEAAQQQ